MPAQHVNAVVLTVRVMIVPVVPAVAWFPQNGIEGLAWVSVTLAVDFQLPVALYATPGRFPLRGKFPLVALFHNAFSEKLGDRHPLSVSADPLFAARSAGDDVLLNCIVCVDDLRFQIDGDPPRLVRNGLNEILDMLLEDVKKLVEPAISDSRSFRDLRP